jgi:hypothetical protein
MPRIGRDGSSENWSSLVLVGAPPIAGTPQCRICESRLRGFELMVGGGRMTQSRFPRGEVSIAGWQPIDHTRSAMPIAMAGVLRIVVHVLAKYQSISEVMNDEAAS